MTHPRNTKGLQQHAQARRQAALERAERAIQSLLAQEHPINFSTVARAASVSTAWLYQQTAFKTRIQQLRSGSALPKPPAGKVRASDDSKATIIATLRQRVEQLEKENRELRKQLEVVYGELAKRQA
jgi:Family of unknown function (DUF6262)